MHTQEYAVVAHIVCWQKKGYGIVSNTTIFSISNVVRGFSTLLSYTPLPFIKQKS